MDDYPAADPIPGPSKENFSELLDFLTHSKEMRQTSRSSMKQAAWAGSGALLGGMLLGPPGGMVGGIVGSIVGYVQADPYDGALVALCQLEEDQRKELMKRVAQVLLAAGATTQQLTSSTSLFRETLSRMMEDRKVRDQVWNACVESLQN